MNETFNIYDILGIIVLIVHFQSILFLFDRRNIFLNVCVYLGFFKFLKPLVSPGCRDMLVYLGLAFGAVGFSPGWGEGWFRLPSWLERGVVPASLPAQGRGGPGFPPGWGEGGPGLPGFLSCCICGLFAAGGAPT